MTRLPDTLGLYVHVPFCVRKCPYCDFNSYPLDKRSPGGYVDAVLVEGERYAGRARGRVATLYVGGGTPTTLPPSDLARLVRTLRDMFGVEAGAEVTVEANPGTVDRAIVEALLGAGVTRLSVGVQSFDAATLRALGRVHGAAEAAAAVEAASLLPSFSVDLMFGVPGQSVASAVADAARAAELGAPHVSAYGLTYEPGTGFHAMRERGELTPASEEVELSAFDGIGDELEAAGIHRYEVSNFARPGHECRHNVGYWEGRDYLGLGAGAHSTLEGDRWWNEGDPAEYTAAVRAGGSPEAGRETLTAYTRYLEGLMLGLRMVRGAELAALAELAEAAGEEGLVERVRQQEELGAVEVSEGRVRLTRSGLRIADAVIGMLA